jgi:EpsI family protein
LAAAIPIAVLTNAARVAGTGILAHHYGPQVAEGFFHTVSGWLLFLTAAVLFGLIGLTLSALAPTHPARVASEPASDPQASGGSVRATGLAGRLGASAALVAAAIVVAGTASEGAVVPLRQSFESFPNRIGPWQGVRESLPSSILDVLRLTNYVNRLYVRSNGIPVWLYVGYYESQRQGQIIHSPQHCLPGAGWTILTHRHVTVALPGRTEPATINQVLIGKENHRQLVLYWYQERGRIVASEYRARLYMLADSVMRGRTDGALVRISAPVGTSEQATLRQMLEFVDTMYPDLAASLPT